MKVQYKGPFDSRTLTAEDLKKVDVEGFTKTVFNRREPVDVPDAVAEVLIGKPKFFGNFEAVSEGEKVDVSQAGGDVDPATPSNAKSTSTSKPSKSSTP